MSSPILPACDVEPGDIFGIIFNNNLTEIQPFEPIVADLPAYILLILILAVPLTFLASAALLRIYRRAVLRSMSARASVPTKETGSPPITSSSEVSLIPPLNITVRDPRADTKTGKPANDLYTRLLRSPWYAATIYSIAGLGFAVVMTSAYLASGRFSFKLLPFLTLLWIFAWPIIPTINILLPTGWRTRLLTVLGYFFLFAVLVIVISSGHPEYGWVQLGWLWLIVNFTAVIFLAVFLHRSIRSVSPLVLIITILGLTGALSTFIYVANNQDLFSLVFRLNEALGLGRYIIIETIIIGLILFGIGGWLVLHWIGKQYKKKWTSEQFITIGALWLVYGVVQSLDPMLMNAAWFLAGILAFAVFAIIAWFGFKVFPFKRLTSRQPPSLLVLRVFSLGKRSEHLFDTIGAYWRYIGSIRLIAGPDLLNTTVEPHEFLDFLGGKLSRRFIDNSKTLALRLAEMDLKPDHDRRFRVNDFFCHDDTWKLVLSRLVESSDAVLMDLRGFTPQNAGCIFEISALIDIIPIQRVLFIMDGTTDEPFLRETMRRSWENMKSTSPNRLPESGTLRLFRLGQFRNRDLRQVLRALTIAADNASEEQQ